MVQIVHVGSTTGDEPQLDSLILPFRAETAPRRSTALVPKLDDLDPDRCLAQLHDRASTGRWQPVTPSLMTALLQQVDERGADACSRVLRYHNGQRITASRYHRLWQRLGRHLPWVTAMEVSTNSLRLTTIAGVERNFGCAVARACAGPARGLDANIAFVRNPMREIATALSVLTFKPHPLARTTENLRTADGVDARIGTRV